MTRDLEKCISQNIHNRSREDIAKSINEWEEAPSNYLQLNYKPLIETEEINSDNDLELDSVSNDEESPEAAENDDQESENEGEATMEVRTSHSE